MLFYAWRVTKQGRPGRVLRRFLSGPPEALIATMTKEGCLELNGYMDMKWNNADDTGTF